MGLSQTDRRILAVLGIVGGVALAGLVGLAVAARSLRHQSQEEAKAGGGLSDADAGIGHLPLSRRVFRAWRPRLILVTEVGPEELDGYEEWKKAGGSVWDR